MQLEEVERARLEFQIAPLVDLVFLLLVFFMVGARFVQPVLDLELSEAASGTRPDESGLLVSIARDGRVSVGGRSIEPAGLESHLRPLLKDNPKRIVTLRADRGIPFEDFVAVMDSVRLAGGVTIQIEHRHAP